MTSNSVGAGAPLAAGPWTTISPRHLAAVRRAYLRDAEWFAAHPGRFYRVRRLWRHEATAGGKEILGTHALVVSKPPRLEMQICPFTAVGMGYEERWAWSSRSEEIADDVSAWQDDQLLALNNLANVAANCLLKNLAFELATDWRRLSWAEIITACLLGPDRRGGVTLTMLDELSAWMRIA